DLLSGCWCIAPQRLPQRRPLLRDEHRPSRGTSIEVFGNQVEGVADNAIAALDASLFEYLYDDLRNFLAHSYLLYAGTGKLARVLFAILTPLWPRRSTNILWFA